MLSREGRVEIARRVAVEGLLIASAVAGIGYGRWGWAALGLVAAVAIYAALPRPRPPEGAWVVDRVPSVYMPDLLAALLVTTFLALPFIIAARDAMLAGPWGPLAITALPAAVSLFIFRLAAGYQCHWVLIRAADLTIATIRGIETIGFDEISEVRGETRRPPSWLAPLLVLVGGRRGAGIALLHGHTPRHALAIERRDGAKIHLPVDSFRPLPELLAGLARAGVALDEDLAAVAGRERARHG